MVPGLATIVGFLVCVEIASGILQGFYTPIFSDIADHLSIQDADVNWFEAAQLVVSALVVPVLARLGDLIGHRQVLLLSTAVTALASWALAFAPNFTMFLIAWAIQGFYVVWLPLEVSIMHRRSAGSGAQARLTRRAAALLVAALELGVIVGAVTSGALVESIGMTGAALPARGRRHRVLRGDLVRGREHAAGRDRAPGPEGLRAGHAVDRSGDGWPDPGPAAGSRLACCRGRCSCSACCRCGRSRGSSSASRSR